MTDSEIIKAFECCYFGKDICEECPYFNENCTYQVRYEIPTQILALINRQKAEIDCLQKQLHKKMYDFETEYDSKIKAEAIKEFAERLKNKLTSCSKAIDGKSEYLICDFDIDNLVKEMAGE